MTTRELTRLTVAPGPDGILNLAAELPSALNGEGPAIAPIPEGPPAYVERVLAAVRPDDPTAPLEQDDVAVVVTTSGSMGEPRGVLLPGSALLASAKASDLRLGGPARWVIALPVHHVAGLQALVRAHLSGIAPLPLDSVGGAHSFSAAEFVTITRAARAISDVDGAPLRTALVPTQVARILETTAGADALAAYDTVLLGGAATPAGLLAGAKRAGANVVTTYGMTETSGGCVYDGLPLSGVTMHLADPDATGVGRIELAGITIASGYRLQPELTAASFGDHLHRASDLGRIDSEGRLIVVGRIDDVVQVGGINVSLAAVEASIYLHPDVAEAAVVATPDDHWGSRVTAFVVAESHPAQPVDPASLIIGVTNLAANALGTEARPREVIVVDALPNLPTGKIDRAALRERAANA